MDKPVPVATSGGVVLTDEVLEALAAEAEAGYDPARLQARPTSELEAARAAVAAGRCYLCRTRPVRHPVSWVCESCVDIP